jgi:hypothetical protein
MDLQEVGCGHRLDWGVRGNGRGRLKEALRCVEDILVLNVEMLGYLARGEEVNILDRLLRSLLLVYLTYMLLY